jgi:pyrrolysine biosynthesis protein PylC
MRVVVAGGKLQGVEAAYLAHQAGWSVLLVDKNPAPPARGLSDQFCHLDIILDSDKLTRIISGADFIIPAIEDEAVLKSLEQVAQRVGIPNACDLPSYSITSSKKRSDRMFMEEGIPAPRYWPECDYPVIAKPSEGSGSKGVRKITDEKELAVFFEEVGSRRDDYLIQEYLAGDSYSIEIIGCPGNYVYLQVTDLYFDSNYDCKRVLAPTELPPQQVQQFQDLGLRIAEKLTMTGIMDVEVIKDQGILKVLEIDARLPSQTPTAVYKSTGTNMLELLYDLFAKGHVDTDPDHAMLRGVVYEHVKITPGKLETLGEHIISQAGCLDYCRDFFGADEALTDYTPGSTSWAATLIITGKDRFQAWERRCQVIKNIREHFRLAG